MQIAKWRKFLNIICLTIIAGQERFKTITSAYYRGADGIILVYDVTSNESFQHINEWLMEVNRYAAPTTAKLLVGNKIDKDGKVVTTESARTFAESLSIPFIETSAKTNENVDTAFSTIAMNLMRAKYVNNMCFSCIIYIIINSDPKAAAAAANGNKVTVDNSNNSKGGCC